MAFKELFEFIDEEEQRRQRLAVKTGQSDCEKAENVANDKAANNHVDDDIIAEADNNEMKDMLKDVRSDSKVDDENIV